MSSYELSQKHNFQTCLWAIGGAIAAVVRFLVALIRFGAMQAYRLGASALVVLFAVGAVLGAVVRLLWALGCFVAPRVTKRTWAALPWLVALSVGVAVVFVIFAYPVVLVGAAIIAAYAVVTFPRKQVSK